MNAIEKFGSENLHLLSDNFKKLMVDITEAKEQLMDKFKNGCFSNEYLYTDMKDNKKEYDHFYVDGKHVYFHRYDDDKSFYNENLDPIYLKNYVVSYILNEKIALYGKYLIDVKMKEVKSMVDIKDADLTKTQKFKKRFFNKKYEKEISKEYRIATQKIEYYITAYDITKVITEEEFISLSLFFNEQKLRKIGEENLKKFNEIL